MSLVRSLIFVTSLLLVVGNSQAYSYPKPDHRLVPLVISCYQPGMVALTFDDGPSRNFPQILETLGNRDITATFFLLGKKLTKSEYLEMALKAVDEGHQIENHGWDHTSFMRMSPAQVVEQVNMTNQIFWDALGVVSRFVRAPHGQIDPKRAIGIWDLDRGVASWNLDPRDYDTDLLWTSETVLNEVRVAIENASPETDSFVIDLHDSSDKTTEVLDQMIQLILDNGFSIVSLNECVDQGRL